MSDAEVPTWRGVKTFYPEMTMQVRAPGPVVLEALATALAAEKFKIKDRDGVGFRASFVDWLGVVAGTLNKTSLDVALTTDADLTQVLVNATSTGEHLTGQKHASRGLSAAVRQLREDGCEVTTTPWAVPEHRKKGKRR